MAVSVAIPTPDLLHLTRAYEAHIPRAAAGAKGAQICLASRCSTQSLSGDPVCGGSGLGSVVLSSTLSI